MERMVEVDMQRTIRCYDKYADTFVHNDKDTGVKK